MQTVFTVMLTYGNHCKPAFLHCICLNKQRAETVSKSVKSDPTHANFDVQVEIEEWEVS